MRKPLAAKSLAVWAVLALPVWTQPSEGRLEPRWTPDGVQFRAPKLHFLEGRVRQRLLDGATVPLLFQVSVAAGEPSMIIRRIAERFAVSYDLWEEKFSVTPLQKGARAFSHKSAAAAESWCLDRLLLPGAGLPEGRGLWFRLDVRAPETAESETAAALANLRGLVDLLSRTGERDATRWALQAGPLTMEQLRKTASP